MTLALLIRLRESSQERYFSEKGVLINDLKASGLGTDLKSLVYLSNTPVIVLLFFFCRHASHSGLGEPLP